MRTGGVVRTRPRSGARANSAVRRTRRKSSIPWPWILALALCAEVCAAVYTSPWTGLRSVTVVGAADADHEWVAAVFQPLLNRPVLGINTAKLRKELLAEPRLKSAAIARGLDGRLTVTVAYRRPFASVQAARSVDVDADGIPFEPTAASQPLRIVLLGDEPVTFGRPMARLEDPLAVLHETVRRRLAKSATISVDRDGQMCLNLSGSAPIRLGTGDRISAKLEALQTILSQDATLLSRAEYLDLKCPEAPAWKRRASAEGQ